jgi:tetratricopeptide (TPR) repeat protein
MKSRNTLVNANFFALFAGTNISVWELIIGCEIKHRSLGTGTIKEIISKDTTSIYITISFTDQTGNISLKVFSIKSIEEGYFEYINVDKSMFPGLDKFIKMKERETDLQNEFNLLKQKYGLSKSSYTSIDSPLHIILLKLEAEESLADEDVQWLKTEQLFNILAIHYEREYKKTGDLWNLVKAASNLRKINKADKVIELLKDKHTNDSKLMSAMLTTCGGAYRDIGEKDKAQEYAYDAIEINNTSYHPYNLMGAIYYDRGLPQEGNKWFARAIELGSNPIIKEIEIKKSFKITGEDVRKRLAEYLLQEDAQKYHWVKKYIKKP